MIIIIIIIIIYTGASACRRLSSWARAFSAAPVVSKRLLFENDM